MHALMDAALTLELAGLASLVVTFTLTVIFDLGVFPSILLWLFVFALAGRLGAGIKGASRYELRYDSDNNPVLTKIEK
jgi:hypothetical protein